MIEHPHLSAPIELVYMGKVSLEQTCLRKPCKRKIYLSYLCGKVHWTKKFSPVDVNFVIDYVWKNMIFMIENKTKHLCHIFCVNPCPAEPGYTLPLQTV